MKKYTIDLLTIIGQFIAIPAVVKFSLNQFFAINSASIITVISLLIGAATIYMTVLSRKDSHSNIRFDDFRISIIRELDDLIKNVEYRDEEIKRDNRDLLKKLKKLEINFDNHVKLFGHPNVVNLVRDTRKDLNEFIKKFNNSTAQSNIIEKINPLDNYIKNNKNDKRSPIN